MNFDLMRLAAAMLVVVSHTFPLSGAEPLRIRGVEDLGALGVSIFFVISGYLVTASYLRDPKSYLVKRILRIEPGLIASLVVTVVLLAFVTTAPAAEYWPAAAMYVVRNALLYPATYELPGVFAAAPLAGVVNGVLWTLRLEFTFYVVLMLIRARPALVYALAAGCGVVWLAMTLATPGWAGEQLTRIAYLGARNGLLFFAGAAFQFVRWRPPLWLGGVSVVAFPLIGPLALPTAVLGLARPGKLPADLSYGIYIYAFPIQQWLAVEGRLNLVTAVLSVVPFAVASWFLVERPAMKLKPGPRPAW
ncbi:acyltransferase [Phenylobacterium sp.]|uniref:acyltransferase family protein n=1 Tax=Phenylobacterium sp. TaxID=1871053 RepID=UPI0025ED36C6|nr:acyltransferase [Phenylobacterium sp.]MBX3484564.1 acyltransferase [Phenylobacterium sp.]MCW5759100.1 acyltransferase [Phenylobacterium sp.]